MKITKKKLRKIIREELMNEGNINLKKGSNDIQTRGNINKIEGATVESIYADESDLKIRFDNKVTLHFEVNAASDSPYHDVEIGSWLMIE